MKSLHLIAGLALLGMLCAYACKRAQESSQPLKDTKARTVLACTFETLSGDITSDRTLSATTVYKIDGCVTVKSGKTLTIPAGTLLLGMKTPTNGGKSFLIVEQGGVLDINGTSTNPVVFTSDQTAGSRAPGDWGGIRIFGKAPNNNANSLTFDLGCASYTGGGSTPADNSGTMEYFQVHFAGAVGGASDRSQAALALNSVGAGTTLDHIQISNALNDGVYLAGGTVKLTNVISYNVDRTDYKVSYGNTSKMQFLSALRLDNAAAPPTFAYAIDVTNQPGIISANTPVTKPQISNLTVQGPNYCNSTPVNSNFQFAIRFADNSAGEIYNSVFTSWRTAATQSGLIVEGTGAISNTTSDDIEFSYNSFHNSGIIPYTSNPTAWSANGGCGLTMTDWLNGSDPCSETGNQFSVGTLGYNSSFCSDFCSAFTSNFTLGLTTLASPNYSWDSGGNFSHITYRGAFGATDWTQSWTQWCAQDKVYCE